MRIRTIKPDFFKSEHIAELPVMTRLLFIGLWCMADCKGRMEDRPKRIKVELLPYDEVDVHAGLDQLHKAGFIVRYKHGESAYIQIPKFNKHQRITGKEAESDSSIPEYIEDGAGKHRGNIGETPETTGKEGKGREGKEEIDREEVRLHGIPKTVEEVIAHGKTCNPLVSEATCRAFFGHYEGQRRISPSGEIFWITGSETVVTNWKAKLPCFSPPRPPRELPGMPQKRNGGKYAHNNI
jgi:hypothetical protein